MNLLTKLKSKEQKQPKEKQKKMIVLRKKQLVSVALLLLIASAGYLNYTFQNDNADPGAVEVYNEANKKLGEAQMVNASEATPKETKAEVSGGYFSEARMEKEIKRDESIDALLELIDSEGADQKAKDDASEQIKNLTDYTEKEITIENMIKARGYKETVVFMGENLVSIAVLSTGLNEVDAAVITDIALSVTGYTADKINIVEIGE